MSESSNINLSETLFQQHKEAKETSSLTQYMPSSSEFFEQKMEQDPFSWYRNLRRLQWAWLG
ncbi:MAG: alpha/beta hydrolase, partial [Vibrio metschnikovii]